MDELNKTAHALYKHPLAFKEAGFRCAYYKSQTGRADTLILYRKLA